MGAQLDIRGSGKAWAVTVDGTALPRHYPDHHLAVAALPGIERTLARAAAVTRPCLCCGAPFASLGKGNRLCRPCRIGGDA